jgi:hypothetical protein
VEVEEMRKLGPTKNEYLGKEKPNLAIPAELPNKSRNGAISISFMDSLERLCRLTRIIWWIR